MHVSLTERLNARQYKGGVVLCARCRIGKLTKTKLVKGCTGCAAATKRLKRLRLYLLSTGQLGTPD